jgi:hypothetical protein
MSINFPTAFWKNQSESDSSTSTPSETAINWGGGCVGVGTVNSLYYGSVDYGNVGTIGKYINPVGYATAGLSLSTTYPFNDATSEDFFPTYGDGNQPIHYDETSIINRPYFGWYITANEGNQGIGSQPLSRYHREDPWIIENNGRKINLFFQADDKTLFELGWVDYYANVGLGEEYSFQYYNHFIQSGYTEGSFNLSEIADLEIKASGLGELNSNEFDLFQLYIDDELICKGTAPGGGGTRPWDMDHCKFFNAGGTQTPASPGTRKNLGTSIKQFESLDATTEISNVVEQTTRRDYVKDSAVFTHTKTNLAIGDHKIKIFYNTNDGRYNSGAFYGATFNFS